MPNYKLGKIYKIIDNTNDNIYIGSTCEYILSRRLAGHRSMYDRYVKGAKNYTTSFEILKNENYCIILLESYPCDTKDQLTARESYYIQNNECVNKVIPDRTNKQYKQDHREKILEQHKEYYNKHKERLLEMNKEHYNDNKEKCIEYTKEYYDKNKAKIREHAHAKYHCICGASITYSGKSQHMKSPKHHNNIKSLSDSSDN